MSRIQANLLLLLAACIWGGGFIAQSSAMDSITPMWFVGIRFAIAALAVLPFALMENRRLGARPTSKQNRNFISVGAALFAGAALQQVGLLTTTVTNTSFLTGLYVIFVPLIAVFIFRRMPNPIVWPGALMMAGGIFLLSGGELSQLTRGDFFNIGSAFFWAAQIIMAGVFVTSSQRPLALCFMQFATCSLLALAVAMVFEPFSWNAVSSSIKEILYVGLISSGLAFVFQVIGQRYTTAPQAAIFLSSEALFGALFAAIFLGEKISYLGYFGCGLIFFAILLVELVPEFTKRRTQRVLS